MKSQWLHHDAGGHNFHRKLGEDVASVFSRLPPSSSLRSSTGLIFYFGMNKLFHFSKFVRQVCRRVRVQLNNRSCAPTRLGAISGERGRSVLTRALSPLSLSLLSPSHSLRCADFAPSPSTFLAHSLFRASVVFDNPPRCVKLIRKTSAGFRIGP